MKKKGLTISGFLAAFLTYTVIFAGSVTAHDLWLNLDRHFLETAGKTDAKIVFGHNYPYYGLLVAQEEVSEFFYLSPSGQKTKIQKTWEEFSGESYGQPAGARVGSVRCPQKGTYIVAAARKRKGDKTHVPSEKYAKSALVVGKGSEEISKPVGHRIEIVPLKNPTDVKAGDLLPVKVLYEGNPLSTYVYGTFAGYFSEDEPFPVIAKSDAVGVAQVKIERPGVWMVVCNHKVDFSASLTFEIK